MEKKTKDNKPAENAQQEWVQARRLQPYRPARALWLAVASSFILTAVMSLGAVDPSTHRLYTSFHLELMGGAFLLLFTLLYIFNFAVIRHWRSSAGWLMATGLVGSLLLALAFTLLNYQLEKTLYGMHFSVLAVALSFNFTAAIIAWLICMLLYNVTQRQLAVLENEHLQAENLRVHHESLEQQVNPHFLFNSLNTLDGLIGHDEARAHQYVQRLAETYRYTLGRQAVATLGEEMQFTRGYVEMMQVRYGESLGLEVNLEPDTLRRSVPPISVQLLVENAIKHNVVTQRHPMTITIECEGDRLRVRNPRQPKTDSGPHSGIGLDNLSQRCRLLTGRDIKVTSSDKYFEVDMPLGNYRE